MTYFEWLAQLKKGDMVMVRSHSGEVMPAATVTDATPCFLFVGKLKFWRDSGWQIKRQRQHVYRMKLRLVRNEQEFQC